MPSTLSPSTQFPLVSESDANAALARLRVSCEVTESAVVANIARRTEWWWQGDLSPTSAITSAFSFDPIEDVGTGVDVDPPLVDGNPPPSLISRAIPPPASIMGNDVNSLEMRRVAACILHDDIAAAQRIVITSPSKFKSGKTSGGFGSCAGFVSSASFSASAVNLRTAASSGSLLPDRRGGTSTCGAEGGGGDSDKLIFRLSANALFASSAAAVGCVSLLCPRNVRHSRKPRNAAGSIAAKAVRAAEAAAVLGTRELDDVEKLKRAALALTEFRFAVIALRIKARTEDLSATQKRVRG